MSERIMPAAVDAERSILGAILLDNEAYFEAASQLRADDFSLESHRRLYTRMVELAEVGKPVDLITVTDELKIRKETEAVGGVSWVSGLMDGLPRRPSIKQYVAIVREKSSLRQVIQAAQSIAIRAYEQQDDADVLIGEFDAELLDISAGTGGEDTELIGAVAFSTVDEIIAQGNSEERKIGLTTGLPELDEAFGGYVKGELTYIGARPSVGKTSMMIDGLIANGSQGIPCLGFSLEMTKKQIMSRMAAKVAGVPAWKMRKPWYLTKEDQAGLRKAAQRILEWPIYINDRSGLTAQQVAAKAKLFKRRHLVKLVMIDFFTKMYIDGKDYRLAANKASEILARLAKDEQIPVVCLAQLKRFENETREPVIADLKETGNLEQDAQNVLLLHRPKKDSKWTGEDKIIIGKARESKADYLDAVYDEDQTSFRATPK